MKKFAFIQGWGTYSNETIVAVGMSHEDVLSYMQRIKAKFSVAKNFLEDKKRLVSFQDSSSGMLWVDESGATILIFKDWQNDWEHWDTLVHEVSHAVHNVLGSHRNMMNEDEARAYQTEYLFREIRRKLWNLTDKKSSKNKKK